MVKHSDCPVCFQEISPAMLVRTHCQHEFCHQCLREWRDASKGKFSCPVCRSTFPQDLLERELERKEREAEEAREDGNATCYPLIFMRCLKRRS